MKRLKSAYEAYGRSLDDDGLVSVAAELVEECLVLKSKLLEHENVRS